MINLYGQLCSCLSNSHRGLYPTCRWWIQNYLWSLQGYLHQPVQVWSLKICFFDAELSDLQKITSYSGFLITLALIEARSNFYSTPIT